MIENPSPEKKYRTEGGNKAEVYAVKEGQMYCVFGAVLMSEGEWQSFVWAENGDVPNHISTQYDLVEIKEEVRYMDFFTDNRDRVFAGTVKLTFEDGKLISTEVVAKPKPHLATARVIWKI